MKNVVHWEEKILQAFCALCLFVALVICLVEIVRRYLFGLSFAWGNESVVYLILVAAFLAMGLALEHDSHIRVDIVDRFIKGRSHKILLVVDLVVEIIYIAAFIIVMGGSIGSLFESGSTSMGMGMPMYIIYGFLFIGFFLMGLHSIKKIYELGRGLFSGR